ncbi:WXG100 family type VII secretion target [Sanguibacter sp. 25GB23B1]|uniref:WXG100 family type VII secretion target n=1 Tax=unclassified Sanguibacter TaxID=2645534 RepID=UPI0032AECE8B
MSVTAALSVWDKINSWMGPLDGLVDALLRPIVAPLADMFDWVTGDSDAVRSTAQRWADLARTIDALVDYQQDVLLPLAQGWDGPAHDAFATAMRDLQDQVREIAEASRQTGDFLDDAAMEIEVAEEMVATIIRELIEWALISLAVSAALALVTWGASSLAGAAAAYAEGAIAASRITAIVTKVAQALTALARAAKVLRAAKLISWHTLAKMMTITPVVKTVTGLTGNPFQALDDLATGVRDIVADELDDQRSGATDLQTPTRDLIDGFVGPAAEFADPVLDYLDPALDVLEDVDRALLANPFGG